MGSIDLFESIPDRYLFSQTLTVSPSYQFAFHSAFRSLRRIYQTLSSQLQLACCHDHLTVALYSVLSLGSWIFFVQDARGEGFRPVAS